MLAVDRVSLSGFCFVLKVCVILWNVSRLGYVQGDEVKPQLTISVKSIKLLSLNETMRSPVTVTCTVHPNDREIGQIRTLKLRRKLDDDVATEEEILVATSAQSTPRLGNSIKNQLSKFKSKGKLFASGGTSTSSISLSNSKPTCDDAALYVCDMEYTSSDGSAKSVSTEKRLPMEPLDFDVFRTPAGEIKPGMKLKLTCSAVIGTVQFAQKTKLVWVYRNRGSSIETQYNALEKELEKNLTETKDQTVRCSERHTATLDLVVDKVRENKRDYFCVVKRVLVVGGLPEYVTRSDGKKTTGINFPTFEEPKVATIGIGGYVGIGIACLAFLVSTVFGVVWCKRRSKKKHDRTLEVEKRKSNIELRRQEIANIVTGKRGSVAEAEEQPSAAVEPEAESAAEGESVAEESNGEAVE